MNQQDVIREHLVKQNASDEVLREFDFARRLIDFTSFYQREAVLCFEANALFAAGILAASALESLLMQCCMTDKDSVSKTSYWKSSYTSSRIFRFTSRYKADPSR